MEELESLSKRRREDLVHNVADSSKQKEHLLVYLESRKGLVPQYRRRLVCALIGSPPRPGQPGQAYGRVMGLLHRQRPCNQLSLAATAGSVSPLFHWTAWHSSGSYRLAIVPLQHILGRPHLESCPAVLLIAASPTKAFAAARWVLLLPDSSWMSSHPSLVVNITKIRSLDSRPRTACRFSLTPPYPFTLLYTEQHTADSPQWASPSKSLCSLSRAAT